MPLDHATSIHRDLNPDDLIVISGAGGFIGGSLARYYHDLGFKRIRAVDNKPLANWYHRVPGVECLSLDVSDPGNCTRAVEGAVEVYNLAADKVIEAKDQAKREIVIWGDGHQTRSFTYIADCVNGIDMITHCDDLIATPINLGSSELIEINHLVNLAEEIGGVRLERKYDLSAPRGVAGRNSDNTFIQQVLGWEPNMPFRDGLVKTYAWIEQQYYDRKAGKRVVQETW